MFFLAPFIINALIGIAVSLASSLIAQMFAQDKKQDQAGVRGSIQIGGDNPLAFIMGRYATAGQLDYAGTWGSNGDTPNAYFTKVVSVSDLPVRGMVGLFVNGERVTILGGGDERGAPVEQYRADGKDHLWVKFYNGTQTVPDAFLLSKFGSDPDRPYQSDMIGRGVAYVVITALVNRELFSGLPDYLIEVDGIPLTDRRGGTAQHDNPIVGIDNVLGGFSYEGQWVYGPQVIGTARRPLSTWQPEMDKCDAIVDGEKAFRFGYEVMVDQEPHVVIGEYLKACEGRIAEIGGVYKPLVGGPNAPVASFTDEDIVITEGQSYEPFPGLEATYNGITATYPEPLEAWENKEAPPRYRSDLEVLDDNRRLPFSTNYGAVPYPIQVQRLMRAAIEETRRFRRHVHTMPPEWWEYEPLDAVVWDSERNGYEGKVFLITAQDDLGNGNQVPALQEQDPADYNWSSGYVLPWDVVPISIVRPAPQEVKGFYVEPIAGRDNEGKARRPGIRIHWNGEQPDVRTIKLTIRLDEGDVPVWEGRPVNFADGVADVLGDPLLASTAYEVQGEYEPFGSRPTIPTGWLSVTTPYIALSLLDVDEEFSSIIGVLIGSGEGTLSERLEVERERLAKLAATGITSSITSHMATERAKAEFTQQISVVVDDTQAAVDFTTILLAQFDQNIAVAASKLATSANEFEALSQIVSETAVEVGGVTAGGIFSMSASAGPSGWSTKISAIVRASVGGQFYEAGWYTLVNSNGDNVFAVKANDFYFLNDSGGVITSPFYIADGTVYIKTAVIQDLSVTTLKIANNAISGSYEAVNNGALYYSGQATQTDLSLAVPVPSDSKVLLFVTVSGYRTSSSDRFSVIFRLRRDGIVLQEKTLSDIGARSSISFAVPDYPGAGTYSYNLQGTHINGANGESASRSIVALVLKK